jgi:hypothetical protein
VLNHEYALVGGLNRAKVGRYLSLIAAAVSASIVFVLLAAVNLAQRWGLPANLTPSILSLVGAGAVFGALYWLFNGYAWKWPVLNRAIKVPNLSGTWECTGTTCALNDAPAQQWKGVVNIYQRWDKIRLRLKTEQSTSDSIAAALVCDDEDGYRLLYNYRNEPRIDAIELTAHIGFCDLKFAPDLDSADGEYFNGRGRATFGTLRLVRM